jgi:hypothetical protein
MKTGFFMENMDIPEFFVEKKPVFHEKPDITVFSNFMGKTGCC